MTGRKVIDAKNLPYKPPVLAGLVWWLVLDKLGAPDWVCGALAALYAIVFIGVLVDIWTCKKITLFNDGV